MDDRMWKGAIIIMKKEVFGTLKDGTSISLYTLRNARGMEAKVTDLGATLVSLFVPDRDGVMRDVVLGYETPQDYVDNTCYFGTVIGRSGNRIDKGRFEINGKTYQLAINDNENNLHSGPDGYDKRKWEVASADCDSCIEFCLNSPDGDQGFPGNCRITVSYTLTEENELVLHYGADCDADTVVNLTNHTYFNLGGHDSGKVLDQKLMLTAKYYTPARDHQAIPTGEIVPVAGTPMDFTTAKPIGQDIEADFEQLKFVGGYDHNFAISEKPGEMKKMAEAYCDKTGIGLEAYTTCCGMQFYAGNFITESKGKGGVSYGPRHGFCLESQFYPNAINQEGFASPLLAAGEHYDSTTVYKFTV